MEITAAISPLLLEPIHVARAWGGLSLLRAYHPEVSAGSGIGETWDIASYPTADCRMLTGPMVGAPLSGLLARAGAAVLGRPWRGFNDFPLLHKFLAPVRDLPLQVHPDDAYALRVEGQNGKAECWLILDCVPGARIFLGLDGVESREHLRRLVAAGELARHARRIPVRNGDVVPIPAGMVHGLGANILAYEVQQNSDVTYRLDDFGLGLDLPEVRSLHLRRAMDVIDLAANLAPMPPFSNWADGEGQYDLAPHFRLACLHVVARRPLQVPDQGRCRGLAVLDGTGSIAGSWGTHDLGKGQSWLLPAGGGPLVVSGDLRLLLSVFPE